jgi:uncharacterized 2Fe-2S/4Fe-4S cluster protein (DUF4445 family)
MKGREVSSTIHFLPMGKRAKARKGESILQLALRIGLPIQSVCGGKKICGKCKVVIERADGALPSPSENEILTLGDLIQKGYRLACETVLTGNATVRIPEESQPGRHVILTSQTAFAYPARVRPNLESYHVSVPAPELHQLSADRERLLLAIERTYGLHLHKLDTSVLRRLPHVLRQDQQGLTAVVRAGEEIIDLRQGRENGLYGIAFDIGTTTVVGYLMGLQTGKKLSVKTALNPQIAFGADVISRISHCQENPDGLEKLRSDIVRCLNQIIAEASGEAGIVPAQILEATAVGNTAMHHLFMGLDPRYVAMAPYPPVLQTSQDIKARDLGLGIGASAYVHLPPLKAGFVGSDTIACILATGVHRRRTPTLLVDLGTNGEIVFGNRDRLLCCSTAAGPAFEGGHIRWGMRAASGAIERIGVDPVSFEVDLKTIDDHRPAGICGSGIISAAAELIRKGILLKTGNFNRKIRTPRLRKGEDGWEFVLAWAPETGAGNDIVLTQKDISELLMAKAAIHAGASLLVELMGGGPVEKILLAGACGNYVDPVDAATIDLFPGCHTARLTGVGNAAGHGSCLVLLDRQKRKEAERIAGEAEYHELAAAPRFQDLFVSGMFFTTASDYRKDF